MPEIVTSPLLLILAGVLGYLLGSVPFGIVITRALGLGDLRAIGSGNIGATNVLRTGRKGLAAATLALDLGKGAAAAMLGKAMCGPLIDIVDAEVIDRDAAGTIRLHGTVKVLAHPARQAALAA